MREKSKILLLTLVMLFLIPISCRMDEIQRVSNQESEFVSKLDGLFMQIKLF